MISSKVRLPNFLMVGAAKAGTTSVYYYLKQHPEIFMCDPKEPKFILSTFAKPFKGIGDEKRQDYVVRSLKEYKELFKNAKNKKIIGEASADNLYYSKKSIPAIKKIFWRSQNINNFKKSN